MFLVPAISFLLTVLFALGAAEGAILRQGLFVGAAIAATVLICSVEGLSAQDIRVRRDDDRTRRD